MKEIQIGIEYMEREKVTCVILSEGKIIYESKARGIFPLYEVHEILEIDIRGSVLVDRIIGKAAAMIACQAGVSHIYGQVMSDNAIKYLEEQGIPYSFEIRTAYIKNREKNGMCPVETRSLASNTYKELKEKIEEFLTSVGMLEVTVKEQTLVIIKPDAVTASNVGRILSLYEDNGLKIKKMSAGIASREKLERHYKEHIGKSFYEDLLAFISEGIAVFLVLSGEEAILKVRKLNGATDPAKADVGTIRNLYGTSIQRNAVHGSESSEAAEKEIEIWFE
jgi:nucleoside-diphosphate kinase